MSTSQFFCLSVAVGAIVAYIIFQTKKNDNSNTNKSQNKTKCRCNSLMDLSISHQISLKLPPRLALITDLDHTLIGLNPNETHDQCNQHIKDFNQIWKTQYAPQNSVLIYATGRNYYKYTLAIAEEKWDLLKPDILITQDGGSIHWFNKSLAQQVQARSTHKIDMRFDDTIDSSAFSWYDKSWEALLTQGWNQQLAEEIHGEVVDKFKLLPLPKGTKDLEMFHLGVLTDGADLAKEIEQLYIARVNEYNKKHIDNPVDIHTFICVARDVDNGYWSVMTPEKAGKGSAVEFLKKRLMISNRNIICVGDSGNDVSMLKINGINSVVVANASDELLRFYNENKDKLNIIKTTKPKTLGVIEGLHYYGSKLLKT